MAGPWENGPEISGQDVEVRRSGDPKIQGSGVQTGCRCSEGWISSRMMDGGSRANPTEV
jgi:hypothetical protein